MLIHIEQNSLNTSLLLANEIKEICRSTFDFYKLNAFTYSRVFTDGSRSELWSNSAALEHTFIKKKYLSGLYTPDLYSSNERYVLLQNKIDNFDKHLKMKYQNQLKDQRIYFNHDHSFMIINKSLQLCEYFIFYAPQENHHIINTYLNNTHNLDNFTKEFKIEARNLIKKADQNKIISAWRNTHNSSNFKNNNTLIENYSLKKLSTREIQVIKLLMQGNSAKSIAKILALSPRTIESHISNIKLKLNCNKIAAVIKKLIIEDWREY